MHTQADGTERGAIRLKSRFGMSIERDSSDAAVTNSSIVDVPCIISGIGSQMGRELTQSESSLLIQRTKVRHIASLNGWVYSASTTSP